MESSIPFPPTITTHVVAMPYPGRGHVNAMLNLSKQLVSINSGILVTFVVTEEWLGLIHSEPKPHNIRFATIPNVIPSEEGRANDFVTFLNAVMTKMEAPFDQLLDRLETPPTIVVYDTFLFWIVRVANRRNIPVASFWPMSASFFAVLKHYHLLEQNGHYPVNVAVGDLHGDLKQARSALEMAGVLSSDGQDLWTGGETVLVQLGDILDRGEDEIAILSLLRSLDKQAKAKGGAVFQVNGNHETMNVEGDFRYVDSGGFEECADFLDYINDSEDVWEGTFTSWVDVSERWKEDRTISRSYWGPWNLVKRQKGIIARSILFRPGGRLACELARHSVVLKVNDWVFCHGGLLPHHVAYGIERMNKEVSEWMRGLKENDDTHKIPFIATRGYDSVVWNRLYSRDTPDLEDYQAKQVSSVLEETLQAVGAKSMVVGHTPQTIGVNCKYNCSIWRVDVGMSSGVLNSRPEVLEIVDNKARVIRSKRDRYSELQAAAYT